MCVGTHLQKRLDRGDQGVNRLDAACRNHDIAYQNNRTDEGRHEADKILKDAAIERIGARNATFGERLAALTVAGAMKMKTGLRKLGTGLKRRRRPRRHVAAVGRKKRGGSGGGGGRITFSRLIRGVSDGLARQQPKSTTAAIKTALMAARKLKQGKRIVGVPRLIRVPSFTGKGLAGLVRFIPVLSGLAAVGSIVQSVVGVFSALKSLRNSQKTTTERKIGSGLYLLPYRGGGRRGGSGLYLRPANMKVYR